MTWDGANEAGEKAWKAVKILFYGTNAFLLALLFLAGTVFDGTEFVIAVDVMAIMYHGYNVNQERRKGLFPYVLRRILDIEKVATVASKEAGIQFRVIGFVDGKLPPDDKERAQKNRAAKRKDSLIPGFTTGSIPYAVKLAICAYLKKNGITVHMCLGETDDQLKLLGQLSKNYVFYGSDSDLFGHMAVFRPDREGFCLIMPEKFREHFGIKSLPQLILIWILSGFFPSLFYSLSLSLSLSL
jgi:hypothetical protein